MEALLVGVVLGLLLGGLGWYLRQQGVRVVGNLFFGAAVLLLLGPGLRLASGALASAARRTAAQRAPSEPSFPAPTEAEIAAIQQTCVQNGVHGISSSARFCQCTAEAWAAARQVDLTTRFTVVGRELRVDGHDRGMDRFYSEFGRCGARSARGWIESTCRAECSGLDCSGHCRCVSDRLHAEGAEVAAAEVWRLGGRWSEARNQCMRPGAR